MDRLAVGALYGGVNKLESSNIPLLENVSGRRRRPSFDERNSKIASMETIDFIDPIFEFLKKEGWTRH